jgi:hypothetical protein
MATMLDCKKIQPLLSEYVDGALESEASWNVKLHLSSCAVCSQVADDLRATAGLLQALPTLEPSANFEAMLAKRLADQVLTPHRPTLLERVREWWETPRALRPVAASAFALAAVVPMAFIALRSQQTLPDPVQVRTIATPNSTRVAETAVDQLWNDHLTYSSTEPLGNGGGMLLPGGDTTPGGDSGL